MDIGIKYNITFSVEQKNKIMRIFSEIGKILPQINGERKRMISLNFILIQVLRIVVFDSLDTFHACLHQVKFGESGVFGKNGVFVNKPFFHVLIQNLVKSVG